MNKLQNISSTVKKGLPENNGKPFLK